MNRFSGKIHAFAIIGFGNRGRAHLRVFEGSAGRICRCVAVSDPRKPDVADRKRFGAAYYRDHRKMLEDHRPDFVIVASPEVFHVPQTLDALRLGIPVYLEKAVSNTWESAIRLYREAKQHNLPLFVGYNLRRMPAAAIVERLIREGRIGRIQSVIGHVNTGSDWAARVFLRGFFRDANLSGDIVLSKLTHDTEWVQHILQTRAKTCTATVAREIWTASPDVPLNPEMTRLARKHRDAPSSHDFCSASGLFENGAAYTFVFTTTGPNYERRYSFNGTEGEITAILHSHQTGAENGSVTLWQNGRKPRSLSIPRVRGGHVGADSRIYEEFFRWLKAGPAGPSEPESIIAGMLIPIAALRSARTGKVVDCSAMIAGALLSKSKNRAATRPAKS